MSLALILIVAAHARRISELEEFVGNALDALDVAQDALCEHGWPAPGCALCEREAA